MARAAVIVAVVAALVAGPVLANPPVSLLAAGVLYGDAPCDFSADVLVGSTLFRVIMDSGSSFFAIADASCTTGCAGVSPLYTGSTSGSFSASYGSGSISGALTTATATLDGLGTSTTFGAIKSAQTFFNPTCTGIAATQGIMGLAYSALAIAGTTPFMDVLTGLGTPDGFALQFCGVTAGQSTTGNYWIGGYDSNFTSSPMRYISIIKKEYFNVQPYSFNINGVTISGTTAISSGTSIIDSGTTEIVLTNSGAYNSLLAAIQSGGFVTFKSGVTSEEIAAFWAGTGSIPEAKLTVNTGVQLQIAFLGNENGNVVDIPVPTTNFIVLYSGAYSFAGFALETASGAINIYGTTLQKTQVVFFDRGSNSRIGFATGANCFTLNATAAGIDNFAAASHLLPVLSTVIVATVLAAIATML